MQDHILIVDDDRQVTWFLERFFARHGYRATAAGTAAAMEKALARDAFSLIVLDLILPDRDGLDVARDLRRTSPVPLIMLTARDEVYDRIIGLEVGADDYVTKPYEPHELLARVRSVLRRARPPTETLAAPAQTAQRLRFADLVIDLSAMRLERAPSRDPVPLTGTEFALLRILVENAGEVLTRDRILATVYGNSVTVTDRAIDAHIARLRRKVDAAAVGESLIRTIHGAGYLLAAEVTADAE